MKTINTDKANQMFLAFCLHITGLVTSCSGNNTLPHPIPLSRQMVNQVNPSEMNNEVLINSWVLVGPFGLDETNGVRDLSHNSLELSHRLLTVFGSPHPSFTVDEIDTICSRRTICSAHSPKGSILELEPLFPGLTRAFIYAVTEIDSTIDSDLGLMYDTNSSSQLWLNGQLVDQVSDHARHPVLTSSRLLPVHVKQGRNVLLLRIDQESESTGNEPWAFAANLMSINRLRDRWLESKNGWLLNSVLIRAGESLHIPLVAETLLLNQEQRLELSVATLDGTRVLHQHFFPPRSWEIKLPPLAEGYYTVNVLIGKRTLKDGFYVGEPHKIYDKLHRLQLTASPATQEYIQLHPIMERYRVLTSPVHRRPLDLNWQKKMVMVLCEGLKATRSPQNAVWSRMPGLHFREFISNIDLTKQNYLLYLPTVKGPVPLVIIMPYALEHQRPFLESSLIAWPSATLQLEHAADLNGMAVAVINGRGTVGDSPIGEADVLEALNDIISSYRIDNQRLYLYAGCEGGRRALLLAERYPLIFASVGLYGPLLRAYDTGRHPHGDPFSLIDQLSSTPVFLVKGELDQQSTTISDLSFYKKLRDLGSQSELEVIPDGMHVRLNLEEKIFPFFRHHTNSRTSVSIRYYTEVAIERARRSLNER